MKDFKNDSTSVLSRFGRDRRQRTESATTERVERRTRSQRDAADSEQPSRGFKRASYNPNFTRDNRPVSEERNSYGSHKEYGGGRQRYGSKPSYGENRSSRYSTYADEDRKSEARGFERRERNAEERSFEGGRDRKFGDRKFGDRKFSDRKGGYGDRKFGDRKFPDEKSGERKFGDRKFGDRKFSDRKGGYGDRKFSDKPSFRKRDDKPASYPKYDPAKQIGEMRLNRFLAQSGLCSRREADDYITAGLVTVNGKIITELGTKVMPSDEVKFNDSRVQGEKKVYLVLNKPKGFVTSADDPHADKTVMELVKGACSERIYPVGRLDKNSLGLLLFTNDGDLTKQLTHPSFKKKKIYQVALDKPLTRADMDRIAEGITLEDGEIYADEIAYVKDNKQEVGIEIHSGRNRIVRRIFEFLGYTVTKLDRVYYAGLTKKNLKRGAWRFLSKEEVERLKSGQYE